MNVDIEYVRIIPNGCCKQIYCTTEKKQIFISNNPTVKEVIDELSEGKDVQYYTIPNYANRTYRNVTGIFLVMKSELVITNYFPEERLFRVCTPPVIHIYYE